MPDYPQPPDLQAAGIALPDMQAGLLSAVAP